jgi:hypothetical protein
MKSMKQQSLHFFLPIFIGVLMGACGGKETEKVSEYDELKYTATEFLENIFYKNFKRSELFCDNISKGSVRKLENFQYDFRNIYFKGIDTCIITKNTATCTCLYEDYDSEEHKQTLELKKYNGEWLVHFVLDESFDNIFLYDYSNEPFKGEGKWNHLGFDMETDIFVKELLETLNSNKLVIGHTSNIELDSIDFNIIKNDGYTADSKVIVGDFQFKQKYSMTDSKIDSYSCDIQNFTENDMQFYYKALVGICIKELGKPFNVREADNKFGYHNFHQLRWFIKGYNEILELSFSPGVFLIRLNKAV